MSSAITYVDLDRAADLVEHRDGIAALFASAFGRSLDVDLWDWAYLANPFGDALVSVALDGDRVVGHYAVVPLDLAGDHGVLRGYLSMTTMVHADYRMLGLFRTLAERVYDRIERRGVPSAVLGFPNDQSAPGFRRKLGWTVLDDVRVVTVPGARLAELADSLRRPAGAVTLDLTPPEVAAWRTGKPGQSWSLVDGVGLKPHAGGHDLMYVGDGADLGAQAPDGPVNVLLDLSRAPEWARSEGFDYRFGYRAFNGRGAVDFFLQMCLSDVF